MKNFFLVLWLTIGLLALISINAFAVGDGKIPGESVYIPKADQDAIYSILQKSDEITNQLTSDGTHILKESISPVYVADFLEYAKTGIFEIKPDVIGTNGNVYISKTITEEGLFAGNMRFYIENDVAYSLGFTPTPVLAHYFDESLGVGGNANLVSRSYADHAKRLQILSGKELLLPITDIRYVVVNMLGEVFYINDGKTESLVLIEADGKVFSEGAGEIVTINASLKLLADKRLREYNESMKKLEEWEKENPDEDIPDGGNGISFITANLTSVNNIVTISEYLGKSGVTETSLSTTDESGNQVGRTFWFYIIPLVAIIGALVMIFGLLRRRTSPRC